MVTQKDKPTQEDNEKVIISIMLMELELNRGHDNVDEDIEIVKKHIPDINNVLGER